MLLIWVGILLSGPGTMLANVSATFLAVVIATLWLSAIFARMLDVATRDLLAARAGSAGTLHLHRLGAVIVVTVPLSALLLAVIKAGSLGSERTWQIEFLLGAALFLAAIACGLTLGALLSAPLIERRSVALFLAIPALIGLAKTPLVESVLLAFSRDTAGELVWLLGAALMIAAAIAVLTSRLVNRRSAASSD